MIFNNYLAELLLRRNFPIDKVKLMLRFFYFVSNLFFYLIFLYKLVSPIPGFVLFITMSLLFDAIRTKMLASYLKGKI